MQSPPISSFVLIIGAMKSGTTSLYRHMKQHPQIAASSVKEPEFFVNDANLETGRADYYRLWDWNPEVHRWALEASVAYTNPGEGPAIARRIASFGADFRFIYVVRSPIERIESQYNHAYSAGWTPRDVGIDDLVEKRPHFIDRTKYAEQLEPYRDVFGRERILVVNTTDLAGSPRTEMQRVVDFLGLDPHAFAGLARAHNPSRGRIIEHPVIAWARRRLWLYEGLQRSVPEALQRPIRAALGKRLTEPFKMLPSSRQKILELLEDDLKRLVDEWGVDISKWNLAADGDARGIESVASGGNSRGPA